MSTEDLHTLLRTEATAAEPAFTMSSREAISRGRRRLRVRRWGAGLGCAAVLAACAIAVPQLLGPTGRHAHAVTQPRYDAQQMPATIERSVAHVLGGDVPAFRSRTIVARDSQNQRLAARYYDKASSWEAHYSWTGTHLFTVTVSRALPGWEKDVDHACKKALGSGYSLTCTMQRGPGGTVQVIRTYALSEDRIPTAGETGPGFGAVKNVDKVAAGRLWFARAVITLRGGDLQSLVEESVKAPTAAAAADQWSVGVDDLRKVGVQPGLAFPEPPTDAQSGCGWYLPNPNLHPSCKR